MKTISEIKKEVITNSSQPKNFEVKIKHEYGNTYTIKLIMGLIDDYERLVKLMKREGYTVFS